MQIIIVPDAGDAGHKQADYAARQIRDALEDVEVFVAIGAVMSVPQMGPVPVGVPATPRTPMYGIGDDGHPLQSPIVEPRELSTDHKLDRFVTLGAATHLD